MFKKIFKGYNEILMLGENLFICLGNILNIICDW